MQSTHPLEAYRQRQDPPMSRALLAKLLGVKRASVFRWEKGRKIDAKLLPEISAKTGISVRALRPDLVELLDEAAQ
jgi:DNA-binding XRE family transcriptional regulator